MGVKVTEKKIIVRMAMEGGKVVEAQLIGIGTKGAAALGGLSRAQNAAGSSSRNFGFQLQNASYQVQDFFVQVGSGTSASRALGQQLPQLLGGFGLFGVLLGTVAAAAIPLAGALFSTKQGAEDASKAIDALSGSLDSYQGFVELSATSTVDLTKKFGDFAGEVRGFADYMQGVSLGRALTDMDAAIDPLKGKLAGVVDALEQVRLAKDFVSRTELMVSQGVASETDLLQARDALEVFKAVAVDAAATLGIMPEQAQQLASAIDQLGSASGIAQIRDQAAEALALIQGWYPAGAALPPELAATASYLNEIVAKSAETAAMSVSISEIMAQFPGLLGSATSQAGGLASAMAGVAANAWEAAKGIAAARSQAVLQSGLNYGKIQNKGDSGPDAAQRDAIAAMPSLRGTIAPGAAGVFKPVKSSGGSGGGGGQSAQNDDLREAQRLFDQTRTDAEKYGIEQTKLNELLASGAITADTYQRAIGMIGEKYKVAGDMGEFFKDLNTDLKDAMLDAAVSGEMSFDKITDAIKRAAAQALLFGEGPLAGLFGGGGGGLFGGGGGGAGLFGSLFGGLFGGARANGGPFESGKAYLVGERGPELAMFGNSGTIIPNNRLTGGGGRGKMDVNINLAGANGDETIRQIVTQAVRQAIDVYDTHALPDRVNAISRDPRRRG